MEAHDESALRFAFDGAHVPYGPVCMQLWLWPRRHRDDASTVDLLTDALGGVRAVAALVHAYTGDSPLASRLAGGGTFAVAHISCNTARSVTVGEFAPAGAEDEAAEAEQDGAEAKAPPPADEREPLQLQLQLRRVVATGVSLSSASARRRGPAVFYFAAPRAACWCARVCAAPCDPAWQLWRRWRRTPRRSANCCCSCVECFAIAAAAACAWPAPLPAAVACARLAVRSDGGAAAVSDLAELGALLSASGAAHDGTGGGGGRGSAELPQWTLHGPPLQRVS